MTYLVLFFWWSFFRFRYTQEREKYTCLGLPNSVMDNPDKSNILRRTIRSHIFLCYCRKHPQRRNSKSYFHTRYFCRKILEFFSMKTGCRVEKISWRNLQYVVKLTNIYRSLAKTTLISCWLIQKLENNMSFYFILFIFYFVSIELLIVVCTAVKQATSWNFTTKNFLLCFWINTYFTIRCYLKIWFFYARAHLYKWVFLLP